MKSHIALILLAILLGAACSNKLPLRVVQSGDKVTVDVQTLGEYQTTVRRIKLVAKESQSVVWELKTQSGTPQINRIELKVGENSVLPTGVASGEYAVVTPAGSAAFSLSPGIDYEIEIWGDRESMKATGAFRLAHPSS